MSKLWQVLKQSKNTKQLLLKQIQILQSYSLQMQLTQDQFLQFATDEVED